MATRSIKVIVLLAVVGCTQAVNPLEVEVLNGFSGQENPCIGEGVVYTCTFQPSLARTAATIRIERSGQGGFDTTVTVFTNSMPQTGSAVIADITLTANLTSSTSVELLIPSTNDQINGSMITCATVPLDGNSQSRMLLVTGSASGPMFDYGSISQSDFTGLSVPLHRPLYGWECVDTYVVIAESSNGGSVTGYVNVTNPRQLLTVVSLSGMDMCKNRYFITAFTVTDANNGQNFSLAGFYPANYSALISIIINTTVTLPLTTNLTWSLLAPPDCVTGYTVSFARSSFDTSDTFVQPADLLSIHAFPFCANQAIKISPIVPAFGSIDSSSSTVLVRIQEGFQSPQEVIIDMMQLLFNSTVSQFNFRMTWNLPSPGDVYVGYSVDSGICEPNIPSNSTTSHSFSLLVPQQFEGVMFRGCIQLQNVDCLSNASSTDVIFPIAIFVSSSSPQRNGFQLIVTRSSSFNVDRLEVTITPNADISVDSSGDDFTVTFTGLVDDLTYQFSIVALNSSGDTLGIPLTGIYSPSKEQRQLCGTGCIVGCVIGIVLVILVIVSIVLMAIYRDAIRKCCSDYCKCSCSCCHHGVEEKDSRNEDKHGADSDPINHEQALTGDEYALVDISSKKKAVPVENKGLYQDPASIQHETAPTGDVYAVTEKKPKKKGLTEEELAQMYSVPDKSKGTGLTYASLDMPGGGGDSEASKRPAPTEYATVIN